MKMNYEHRCTPTFRIARSILLLLFVIIARAFSAEWKIEEAPNIYSYHWEIGQDELTAFVKGGHISAKGLAGSICFQGHYYPVYTMLLENYPNQLAFRLKNVEEIELPSKEIDIQDDNIDPTAIDDFNISAFKNFVTLDEIHGIGNLLQLMP